MEKIYHTTGTLVIGEKEYTDPILRLTNTVNTPGHMDGDEHVEDAHYFSMDVMEEVDGQLEGGYENMTELIRGEGTKTDQEFQELAEAWIKEKGLTIYVIK